MEYGSDAHGRYIKELLGKDENQIFILPVDAEDDENYAILKTPLELKYKRIDHSHFDFYVISGEGYKVDEDRNISELPQPIYTLAEHQLNLLLISDMYEIY
jgi:hypothetical protein